MLLITLFNAKFNYFKHSFSDIIEQSPRSKELLYQGKNRFFYTYNFFTNEKNFFTKKKNLFTHWKKRFASLLMKYFLFQTIHRHKDYSIRTKRNDIALIHLSKSIVFDQDIRPACIETDMNDKNPNIALNVTGWGSTDVSSKNFHD